MSLNEIMEGVVLVVIPSIWRNYTEFCVVAIIVLVALGIAAIRGDLD